MYLLILDSLGTSEMLLILAVAMIFFGPRKLPQLSKQIGKSLAEFRKASDDFKRTWEREVSLEDTKTTVTSYSNSPNESIVATTVERSQTIHEIGVGNDSTIIDVTASSATIMNEPAAISSGDQPAKVEPARKQDWL